ncbi:MAG: acylneuraminate cytidylyltransferase [Ignavibacteriae bacterium HGW-Ignavibacteriae-3]|nr:MAG: acylneuraminate cytidylyltransferase [Ignavibacteriae bacterium HGW-Ignavibacteriae-3]
MKIVTVIQARMTSTRLPGKVMLPILGKPLLIRMIERVAASDLAGEIVVAASKNNEDDCIEKLCVQEKIKCFRGSLTDLLDRHYQAGKITGAEAVVKIPSDCPLIDPRVIDRVLRYYTDNYDKFDFVSNLHPATYPDGNDVEVISFEALERAWNEAERNFEREHTTPYIWENPDKFRIANIEWESGLDYSASHRWTIDFEEDYLLIKSIYEELYSNNSTFSLNEILDLLKRKPELTAINKKYLGKYWYENHLNELKHIDEYKNKTSLK